MWLRTNILWNVEELFSGVAAVHMFQPVPARIARIVLGSVHSNGNRTAIYQNSRQEAFRMSMYLGKGGGHKISFFF